MRKLPILALLCLLFYNLPVFAQDKAACEKVVAITYSAVQSKNTDSLLQYLSEDFTIAGQTGEIARKVLPQLFGRLDILSFKALTAVQSEFLTLEYETEFVKLGSRKSTFIFNNQNQLKELRLLEIEVKTMKNETKVEKPKDKVLSIPFRLKGKLILVEAMVNGIKRNFIIDNGASKLIFNRMHSSRGDQAIISSSSSASGVGGSIQNMDIEKVKNFDFAGIRIRDEDVLLMDLSHLEKSLKTDIYGLIGYEIIKEFDLLLDYDGKILRLIQPEHSQHYLKQQFPDRKIMDVPVQMHNHLPVIDAALADSIYTFGIDYGASTNLIDAALFERLKNKMGKIKTETLSGADKNRTLVKSSKLKSLTIGDLLFENASVVFSDMGKFNKVGAVRINGLIGYDILKRHATLLSYVNKKFIIIN